MRIAKVFTWKTLTLIVLVTTIVIIGVKVIQLISINNLEDCGTSSLPLIDNYSSNSITLRINDGIKLKVGDRYSYQYANEKLTIGLLRMNGPEATLYYRNRAVYKGEGPGTPKTVVVTCKKHINLERYFERYEAGDLLLPKTISDEWDVLFSIDHTGRYKLYGSSAQTLSASYMVVKRKIASVARTLKIFLETSCYENKTDAYDAFLIYRPQFASQTGRIERMGLKSAIPDHLDGCGTFSCSYAAQFNTCIVDLSVQAPNNADPYSIPSLEEMQTLVAAIEENLIKSTDKE